MTFFNQWDLQCACCFNLHGQGDAVGEVVFQIIQPQRMGAFVSDKQQPKLHLKASTLGTSGTWRTEVLTWGAPTCACFVAFQLQVLDVLREQSHVELITGIHLGHYQDMNKSPNSGKGATGTCNKGV